MDQNRAIQQGDEVEYTPVLSKDKVRACVRACMHAWSLWLNANLLLKLQCTYIVGSYAKPNRSFSFHSVVHTYVRTYNRNSTGSSIL